MKRLITIVVILIYVFVSVSVSRQSRRRVLPEGTFVLRNVDYVTNGHQRQKLDLYLPKSETKTPVIIWIHGGAWLEGDKMNTIGLEYVSQGYAVVSINYRLSQHAIYPAQIEDCKAAVRWLRARANDYNLDPNNFAAWGESAGGHLAALLGVTGDVNEFDVGENLEFSSGVQAVVDCFGPTDFLQMDEHRLEEGMWHNPADSPESKLIGGAIQENKEKVKRANPITYVTKADCPFLIIHGDKDPLVPYNQSELLNEALLKAEVPVTFYTVKGGGHGGFTDPNVPKLIKDFLNKHLKKDTKPATADSS